MLEQAKGEAKSTLLATLEEGKVLEGVVKNITDYGIFVDLGAWTGCCTSPTSPTVGCATPPTSSRWETPLMSRC